MDEWIREFKVTFFAQVRPNRQTWTTVRETQRTEGSEIMNGWMDAGAQPEMA